MKHSFKVVLGVLLIISVVLSACAPAVAPRPGCGRPRKFRRL